MWPEAAAHLQRRWSAEKVRQPAARACSLQKPSGGPVDVVAQMRVARGRRHICAPRLVGVIAARRLLVELHGGMWHPTVASDTRRGGSCLPGQAAGAGTSNAKRVADPSIASAARHTALSALLSCRSVRRSATCINSRRNNVARGASCHREATPTAPAATLREDSSPKLVPLWSCFHQHLLKTANCAGRYEEVPRR